jgi:hypothetical protein
MATSTSKLKVSELDFDAIKSNLKNFMGDQNEFADYDFDASALSVLLDLLAYNTHYNAFYLNMVVNEMFLDTASIRNSVVSRAKHLGYTPQSVRGSKAYVDLTITPTDTPATIVIEKNTQFSSSVGGISYLFGTSNSVTLNVNSNGVYTTANVELNQGIPLTHKYTANTKSPDQQFLLPNSNTDTSTLTVQIQTSAEDSTTFTYAMANDTTAVTATSNVYFLEESEDGKYEVLFGDNVIGRKPVTGNVILLSSMIADADNPNGAATFAPVSSVGGYSIVSVSTLGVASGGAERDSIKEIKFNAPRSYQAQNRAVTVNDYKRILERDYPAAESVVVWGGETNDPPVFGKVYLAIKPKSGLTLSSSTKTYIKDTILSNRNVVSVSPEITDPDYLYVSIDSKVKYDSTNTTLTAGSIQSLLTNTIYQYGQTELGLYADQFRYSPLIKKIDETESAIESSLTTIKLRRSFAPSLNVASSYTLKFSNEIPVISGIPQISSTEFSHFDDNSILRTGCSLRDTDGILQVYRTSGASSIIVANNVGTVTYASGNVALTTFKPIVISDGTANVDVTVSLESNDISPLREQILLISNNDITISMFDTGGSGGSTSISNTSTTTTTTSTTSTSGSSY